MKEFFEDVKCILKESSEKDNDEEMSLLDKQKLSKELYDDDDKTELKALGLVVLMVTIVLVIIFSIFFAFRKVIASGFDKVVDILIVKSDKIVGKDGKISGDGKDRDNSIFSSHINCSGNYNANYSGKYKLNNSLVVENVSLFDDGMFVRHIGNNDTTGSYTINNKIVNLNEEKVFGVVDTVYTYQISDDCRSLTRYLNDGTAIVLKIE